jgi:thiol:disulfide interchange protein DsbD
MNRYIILFAMAIEAVPIVSRSQEAARPLPINEAYQLNADVGMPGAVKLHWTIAPGYYLYRGQMKFKGSEGVMLGEAELPNGKRYHDEYLGDVETYRGGIDVTMPYTLAPGVHRIRFSVRSQGCHEADPKICYPPRTEEFDLPAPSSTDVPDPATGPADGRILIRTGWLGDFVAFEA